ncbi:hypothetical protein RUM44_009482 [Polyplax serrata]|uniref:Uncharacterized protein n=1 Tax=Polyplax serrata TaxID=468196 RepID=A0ABR1AST9_POLSC
MKERVEGKNVAFSTVDFREQLCVRCMASERLQTPLEKGTGTRTGTRFDNKKSKTFKCEEIKCVKMGNQLQTGTKSLKRTFYLQVQSEKKYLSRKMMREKEAMMSEVDATTGSTSKEHEAKGGGGGGGSCTSNDSSNSRKKSVEEEKAKTWSCYCPISSHLTWIY